MSFVDLSRCFVAIGKDQEPALDAGVWGLRYLGWLDWARLLENRRVVLLAEASSGKTEEFGHQQRVLSSQGKPAFFIRIEELADQGFEAALEPSSARAFEEWRGGTGEGFFFLDSVDEARLNRKSFETALKRFARELDRAGERARVFISCRVSDWRARDDRALIERILPAWEQPQEPAELGDPLLDPIFKNQQATTTRREKVEATPNQLLVVQILPLSSDQCRSFVAALGVTDPDAFMNGIQNSGLDAFTQRPGDILDLADYWKTYGRFGSLSEMIEHAINRKLNEQDPHRPDNDVLTPTKARQGVERIAAALTLGKSSTMRAPGHDPDPSLASGALDSSLVLPEWSGRETAALLRRGIFAPSTYGRIRFHHRTTQEYLTAQWLDQLLQSNCPRDEIWNLIFAERYGVKTLVPSLRPAAAWLALRHSDFRDETIRREPLVLVRHGDAGSLPLDAKKRVLLSYATKDARAEISDDSLDNRALWLFADQGLADAVREAWAANTRSDFRMDLLRLIREKAMVGCLDLAREAVADQTLGDYHRVVALQAMANCHDAQGLSQAAADLTANSEATNARIASNFAKILFPRYLSVDELFALIANDRKSGERGMDGFEYAISDLYNACPDAETRSRFIANLADLCLAPPFVQTWQRISAQHSDLAKQLDPIAKAEVAALNGQGAPAHAVRLLMATERAESHHASDDGPTLFALVRANTELNRALFWADVDEQQRNEHNPVQFWQIIIHGATFWRIDPVDLDWLFDDLANRPRLEDKRIALSAIAAIFRGEGRLNDELPRLRQIVAHDQTLSSDLVEHAEPPRAGTLMAEEEARRAERQRERDQQEQEAKESWVRFGQYLRTHLGQLTDPKALATWKDGAFRLWHLSEWLAKRTGRFDENSFQQWRLLEEGFGREVAEAFRDGLRVLWRVMKPERPRHKKGGQTITKNTTLLAFYAVSVEAAEDPEWTSRLSEAEAKLAAQHGTVSERSFPDWIGDLIATYPQAVLPILRKQIERECKAPGPGRSDFLHHYSRGTALIQPALQPILFKVISANEPVDPYKLDLAVQLVSRLDLSADQRNSLARAARRRLARHEKAKRTEHAIRYLAVLLMIDPENAVDDVGKWLARPRGKNRRTRAEQTFSFLFDRHGPVVPGLLSALNVQGLEQLLRLAYTYIRPEDDAAHEGSYTPDLRDHAESARNTILSALLDRSGEDAHRALKRLALVPAVKIRRERFEQLARGKAERDSELPEWRPAEVAAFERTHSAPVKTGSDLLRVVVGVLRDIQLQMDKGDVTSRPLVQRAQTEDEARNWLVEQMNARARSRFLAHREAQIAGKARPDIIITSNAAPCEVAMEVKHGGKKWTTRQLENAVRVQLADDYLNPATRRHGVFVITNHGPRRWRDPGTREVLTFEKLMRWLASVANSINANSTGPVKVVAFGLDIAGPTERSESERRSG